MTLMMLMLPKRNLFCSDEYNHYNQENFYNNKPTNKKPQKAAGNDSLVYKFEFFGKIKLEHKRKQDSSVGGIHTLSQMIK